MATSNLPDVKSVFASALWELDSATRDCGTECQLREGAERGVWCYLLLLPRLGTSGAAGCFRRHPRPGWAVRVVRVVRTRPKPCRGWLPLSTDQMDQAEFGQPGTARADGSRLRMQDKAVGGVQMGSAGPIDGVANSTREIDWAKSPFFHMHRFASLQVPRLEPGLRLCLAG